MEVKDQTLQKWLETATPSNIELALEVGYRNVESVRFAINAARMQAVPTTLPVTLPTTLPVTLPTTLPTTVQQGIAGEERVMECLEQYNVSNVAKQSKTGDITLLLESRKILVEVKNYTGTVPKISIDKFKRDLSTGGADGGLFISLHTPIAGHGLLKVVMESTDCKVIPAIYIATDSTHIICLCVELISSMIKHASYNPTADAVENMRFTADTIAKLRESILCDSAETVSSATKTASRLLLVESRIRDMCSVEYSTSPHVSSVLKFGGGSQPLAAVLDKIEQLYPTEIEPQWTQTAKKCKHSSSIYITVNKAGPSICFPRTMPPNVVATLYTRCAQDLTLSDSVQIAVNAGTLSAILEVLELKLA
jgi:hypothetical protein